MCPRKPLFSSELSIIEAKSRGQEVLDLEQEIDVDDDVDDPQQAIDLDEATDEDEVSLPEEVVAPPTSPAASPSPKKKTRKKRSHLKIVAYGANAETRKTVRGKHAPLF